MLSAPNTCSNSAQRWGNRSSIYLSAASGFRALKAMAERESQVQQMLRSALAEIPSQAPLLDADEGRRYAGCFCLLCPVLSRTSSDGNGLSIARILWLVCSVALSSSALFIAICFRTAPWHGKPWGWSQLSQWSRS